MCVTCKVLFPKLRQFGSTNGLDLAPDMVVHFRPDHPNTVLVRFKKDLVWGYQKMWEFMECLYESGIEHNPDLFDQWDSASYDIMLRLKVQKFDI
jgi:hypothetical protein